ncbi:uncharacterized protein [Cebidichthys violaceus]|uniref:uncharacterized protein n=1 Tax=Cebidichthys violaceus TaxID=271503 RepID=UPI0035CC9C4D
MTAEIKEDMKLIEKLQKDLEASSCHHEKEAQRNMVSFAKIKALKDELIEQQEESLEKDDTIQSLRLDIQNLQSDVEAKDHIVSTLQEKVNRGASDLNEEQTKNCSPQRDYEAGVSQQLKEAEELDHLTHENQHLASENRWLQGELEAAQTESQLHQKQLQDDREACSRREEAVEKENDARFQMQEKELSEKTLALEKSLVGEKLLRSLLGSEKKRFDQMILKKQASVEPLTILRNQLRDASANSEHLMYDMKTLRMENADIRAKFHVMETEFDRTRSKHLSLSERHEELMSKQNDTMSKQNDTISENQLTITKLQCAVDWLKAQQSESKTGRAELEDALKQYKATVSELQQIASALEKERARCEEQRVKLKEALTRQIEILEEKQEVAVALKKAQDDVCRLQGQQLVESNFQLRHISDAELRLNQQRTALEESTKALHHLQREYTDLGRRHSDINSDYHELLKTHSALQIKYERLCYAQGNPRPDFSPPLFSQTVI